MKSKRYYSKTFLRTAFNRLLGFFHFPVDSTTFHTGFLDMHHILVCLEHTASICASVTVNAAQLSALQKTICDQKVSFECPGVVMETINVRGHVELYVSGERSSCSIPTKSLSTQKMSPMSRETDRSVPTIEKFRTAQAR